MFSRQLSDRFDRRVHVKLEMMSPVRSFKYRGATVAVDTARSSPGVATIVTASTGNHGQGIAYAGRRAGLDVIIYSPKTAVAEKVEAMRALGADVRIDGDHLGESQEIAEANTGTGAFYIEDGENGDLMAGAATVFSEMIETWPQLDTVVCPVGGGNLIAGALLANQLAEQSRLIVGVQSTAASGVTQSWVEGAVLEADCSTFAGGLATTRPGHASLAVMTRYLDRMVLVHDDDLYAAMAMSLTEIGVMLEGAAAAPLAALERCNDEIPGDDIGLVLTGSWAGHDELRRAFALMQRASAP